MDKTNVVMHQLIRSLAFIVCCVSLGLLSSCNVPDSETSTLEKIKRDKIVRVGFANEAPYAYKDTATGKLTGEAPEIARTILADLGDIKIEGVLTEFGSLIPGLKAGRFDVIAAGMYIAPERCQQIAFSNPTYSIGAAIAVQKGNPKSIHSFKDIADNPDITLGHVIGSIFKKYALSNNIPKEQLISFPDAASGIAGVKSGRVDGYAATSLTVADLLRKESTNEVIFAEPFTQPTVDGASVRGYGAFGFRHGDQDLKQYFDQKLANFIGTDAHLELVKPFGFTQRELPGDETAAHLCQG